MARYQLRRPSPVQIIPRRVRRQDATATTMPVNEDKGPESPDSPFSSPSTVGGSDSESSDSEDEEDEKDEKKSSSSPTTSSPFQPVQTLGPDPTQKPSLPASLIENNSTVTSQTYDGVLSMIPSTTLGTTTSATSLSSSPYRTQSERKKQASPTASPTTSTATSSITSLPPVPVSSAEAEMNGQTGASQMLPQDEPIMTKEAMIAAIVLGVLGALALLAAAVIFFKRHRWRKRMNHMPLQDEPYDAPNGQFPSPPDVAHVGTASSVFARLNGAANGGAERHLTRSTERSNTLFGASPYIRPETVSTDRNNSRMPPPTPNPFADPQRNKAYDMLNNRPRSTTLTDRGSWRENPFKNPASERFDPFGELKEKARRERLKYLQEAKREAELQRQMQQKEAMGLRPDDMPWGADNGYR